MPGANPRTLFYLLATLSTGFSCRSTRYEGPLEAPTVAIGVENVSSSELQRLERFFGQELPHEWAVTGNGSLTVEDASTGSIDRRWTVRLGRWRDLQRLHRLLTSLRDDETGHAILRSTQTDAELLYTSSRARTRSSAAIAIQVTPRDAALIFDTDIQGAGIAAGRPVETDDGRFELALPFSFIRSARRYFYFHSLYRGQYRYYRYDLDEERQELLRGIRTPEHFRRYRR